MEIKGDELVYNRGALGSAKAYAEKNGEEEVLKKLKAIYEHLDLEFEAYRFKCDCGEDCEIYGCEPKAFEDEENKGDGKPEGGEEPKVDEPAGEEPHGDDPEEEPEEEKKYTEEEVKAMCDELKMKCESADAKCAELEAKCGEYEAKCGDYEKMCGDYENRCTEYEKRCAELEEKCANYESTAGKIKLELDECVAKMCDYEELKKSRDEMAEKLAVMKVKEQRDYIDEVCSRMKFTAEEMKDVIEKCEARGYECVEDIDKDIAYVAFRKTKEAVFAERSESFNVNIVETNKQKSGRQEKTLRERLKDNIKNN